MKNENQKDYLTTVGSWDKNGNFTASDADRRAYNEKCDCRKENEKCDCINLRDDANGVNCDAERDGVNGKADREDCEAANRSARREDDGSKTDIGEKEFLNALKRSAETGKNSIATVLKKTRDDTRIKDKLLQQYETYDDFENKVVGALARLGETPKGDDPFAHAMMWSAINMSTLMDNSDSKLAQLVIEGNNMGIIEMNKKLNGAKNGAISNTAREFALELLKTQQKHIDELRKYL